MKVENIILKLGKYIKILFRVPLHLVYFLSFLSPRDEKIWVFGGTSGGCFADNSKYFFLHLANNFKDKIRAMWISRNKKAVKELQQGGYEAYTSHSLKGLYYSLRAKCFVTSSDLAHLNYWLSNRAKTINLWHGAPLKRIDEVRMGDPAERIYQLKGFRKFIYRLFSPWRFQKWNYFITTSALFKKIFSSAFRVEKNNVIITGYPRNDIFFREFKDSDIGCQKSTLGNLEELKKKYPRAKFIIYMPTYRDTKGSPLIDAGFNFEKLNQLLEVYNSFFILKLHLVTNIKADKINFERIIFLPPKVDVYPLLSSMDILITDYSSVSSDSLLLNKPIIFFPYDFKNYITKDRELYFDYDQFTPGPKAYNFDELLNWLRYFLEGKDDYAKQREKIRNLCFQYIDGKSSERIANILLNKSI